MSFLKDTTRRRVHPAPMRWYGRHLHCTSTRFVLREGRCAFPLPLRFAGQVLRKPLDGPSDHLVLWGCRFDGAAMTNITVHLPDEHVRQLEERAARLQISIEELARLTLEDLLAKPDEEFRLAVQQTLKKNAELYRRLA